MAAVSRPFLQLVRHARSAAARAAIHLLRRQRQSGRASDRARQCVPGMGRPSSRRGAALARRQPTRSTSRATRCRRPARRSPNSDRDVASARRRARGGRSGFAAGLSAKVDCRTQLAGLRAKSRPWSTSPARLRSNVGTQPARKCCSGRERSRLDRSASASIWSMPTGALVQRERLAALEDTARSMALAMEFGFLLDRDRQLLSIGYLVPEGALDPNCYDLLASEARLASFFAIAKGDIPAHHWFRLGRACDAGRARRRADFLVRLDVRVSDAVARHARAGRKPARADKPSDRAPPDCLCHDARPAVGHFGIGL